MDFQARLSERLLRCSARGQAAIFLLHSEQIDKSAEQAFADFAESRHMLRCFAVDLLDMMVAAQGGNFFLVLRNFQPAMDHRLVDFHVKLKAVDFCAVAKSLIGAERGESEMARAIRHVEGFAVPLKDFLALLQRRKQRIAAGVSRRRDIVPADFLLRVSVNRSAERLGDQLRAEANAQNRRSEEHTSELQSPCNLVCSLLRGNKKD